MSCRKNTLKKDVATPADNRIKTYWIVGVIVYAALVLGIDALAVAGVSFPIDWSVFQWRPASLWRALSLAPPEWTTALRSFDLYKSLLWFAVPFCLCLRGMDWRWFSPRGWKRLDWGLLGILMLLGSVAVFSVRYIPSLREVYPGMSHLPAELRRSYAVVHMVWVLSWLPGWEFLHRYFLLRPLTDRFPRYGWLLIPVFEGVYHLQKPLIEAGGMVLFSLVLTGWSVRRRNLLLPFLAHLYIEILLIVCLYWLL